jgi:hypothetical protein
VRFPPGSGWELRSGWKRRRNDTTAHIVAISYSGERKGAGTVKSQLTQIDFFIKRAYPVQMAVFYFQ